MLSTTLNSASKTELSIAHKCGAQLRFIVFCSGGSLWIYRCESHTLMPPIRRILQDLNLKASSYKTLDDNFRHRAWLPTLPGSPCAWNISKGTRIRFGKAKLICKLEGVIKIYLKASWQGWSLKWKGLSAQERKLNLVFFNQTMNSHYRLIFRMTP